MFSGLSFYFPIKWFFVLVTGSLWSLSMKMSLNFCEEFCKSINEFKNISTSLGNQRKKKKYWYMFAYSTIKYRI
jgi:hypothetical protein